MKTLMRLLLVTAAISFIPAIALAQTNPTVEPAVKTEEAAQPIVKILEPTADTVLDGLSSRVTVQYPIGASLELRVNGELVDSSQIGRTETNQETKLITQTWYGVIFRPGENTLSALAVLGTTGRETTVTVMVPGKPSQLELETVEARIPADGRSTATVQGQLIDENGTPANWDTTVTLNASAGEFIGDLDPDRPGFQVKAQLGRFTATLRSSRKAQTVRIRAQAQGLEAFTQIQFETELRPSTLVSGFVDFRIGARGTDYYSSFRDYLPADEDNTTEIDLTSAAFATGSIGDWQFTGAFNSDRPLNEDPDGEVRLFRNYQASELEYPVYGDSSTVETTAPSTDNLYLRFERFSPVEGADPDYLMWGDYDTEEFSTSSQEFSAVTRQLHGFKANYSVGNLQVTGFYGNNVEGFQRDTIAPDGTAGFYLLSRRLLIPGSEDVFIESEVLNDPGTLVRRERLVLGADYEIDYDRGSLLFKEPIFRTDVDDETGAVLVRRIVVTYQFEAQAETQIYAGRLRYHLLRDIDRESWLGATYLREDRDGQDFELLGADAQIALGTNGQLIAEYARSTNGSVFAESVSGSAYRLEAEGEFLPGVLSRAYYRAADEGFSNNATVSFVPGQTRYGAETQAQITPTTSLRLSYDHQDNAGVAPRPLDELEEFLDPLTEPIPGAEVDNSLTTITAGVQQRFGAADLTVDWIHRDRRDRIAPEDLSGTSSQLRSRLGVPITDTLTFQALNETTLSAQTDAVFSDRTALGLDWEVQPGITVSLAQQWFTRGQLEGQSLTSLGVGGDYSLGTDTTLTGRYTLVNGINGMTGQGAIGLKQQWAIAPGLRLDLGYEHVFESSLNRTASGEQFRQPFAFGQSASALGFGSGDSYSIGIEYTGSPDFKASARWNHRTASRGNNTVFSVNAAGKMSPALTALLTYDQASAANQTLDDLDTTRELRVGLAYRPPEDDRINALLRYEYRQNPSLIPETILFGTGTGSQDHVFALETIFAPDWRWEFYGKFALRNSTTDLADDFVAESTVSLAQLRAAYRLSDSLDLVGEIRWITQPSADYGEMGLLLEAGYYLTPELRLYAGYAFGDLDDRDFSGTRSAGGPYLGLAVKLNGLFDGFGEQPALPPPPDSEEENDDSSS